MSKYLVSVVETYRVDTEDEAVKLIEEAKHNNKYELTKYTNEHKEVKQKGEIVDEYQKVSLTKFINDIKDPYEGTQIEYYRPGERENTF